MSGVSLTTKRGLTIPEAAAYIGLHQSSLYRLARDGQIKIRKIGGRSIILKDDIDRLLESASVVHYEAT